MFSFFNVWNIFLVLLKCGWFTVLISALQQSDCYTHIYIHIAEKAMAPHSSTLAWKILWMEEPGRLQSMGSLRVGHDWATSLSPFTFMYWRRKWQPTPVFLPGESQGRGSLVGCHLWGRTESDTTDLAAYSYRTMFCYGLSQHIEYSSLCSTVGPCCLSILYITVC